MKNSILFRLAFASLLILSACSTEPAVESEPDADVQEVAASDTPLPPATTAPTEVSRELPGTTVVGILGDSASNTYKVSLSDFSGLDFTDDDLPAAPGSIEAHWYQADGVYVVAYIGLDVDDSGPLCPGNSIRTSSGFENVSNAPSEEGACEGFSTVTSDPNVGPRVCQGTMLYVTAIPSSKGGTLYGTLEALADEGEALIGLTSQADSSGGAPEIDLDLICG